MKHAINIRILLALSLGLALAALCLSLNPGAALSKAPAAEVHVCPVGCPYSSAQAAVDAANEGDIIKVATGGDGFITVTREITGDPAFAPDGYHLTAGSAAIDQGIDAGVTTDIDNQPRPQGIAPDLGADEYWLPDKRVYLPLVLR